jgi:catalase
MTGADVYEQLVDAANAIYGAHPRRRALHTKGSWCRGTFTAAPDAAGLSRAAIFSGEQVPALIRFSNASGDPASDDADRDGRGMAVKLRPERGEEGDILATMAPCFVARTPEDFLELMRLRRPDPETGRPDLETLGAYLAAHPEAGPAIQAVIGSEPPASFATLTYYSPHAFFLVDSADEQTAVRYHWRPHAGEERIPDDAARARGPDYLREELAARLADRPVEFDLLLQLAGEGDPLVDPTAIWPEDRELVAAGRLEITEAVDDPETADHIEVFDPTRIGDGIELSDDPILHARPKAYSASAYRRWERGPGGSR